MAGHDSEAVCMMHVFFVCWMTSHFARSIYTPTHLLYVMHMRVERSIKRDNDNLRIQLIRIIILMFMCTCVCVCVCVQESIYIRFYRPTVRPSMLWSASPPAGLWVIMNLSWWLDAQEIDTLFYSFSLPSSSFRLYLRENKDKLLKKRKRECQKVTDYKV